jgi:uncharacterized protein (DUF2249 family)
MPDLMNAPIVATDRVSDVIARDEALVEIFVRHAAQFERLRSRTLRRVMGRLVTVEQAARMGGVAVELLLRDLNGALTAPLAEDTPIAVAVACAKPPLAHETKPALHGYPPGSEVVEVDVREDLRAGREPFSKIMSAVGALRPAQVLRVRAIFEPVPLFTALAKRGLTHASRQDGPDDWSVWFWRAAPGVIAPPAPGEQLSLPNGLPPDAPLPDAVPLDAMTAVPSTVWLDVRGLMPPEPLLRTLAALDTLPDGHQLVQVNARVPELLFPLLAERGFACEVDESRADRVLVRVWRAGGC